MEEESDEDHEDEASEFTPNGDQVSRRKSSVSQYSNNNINNINNPNNFNGNNSNYNGSINKNDIQNSTPDYSRLASISAKLDISDYTRQMEEVYLLTNLIINKFNSCSVFVIFAFFVVD